MGSKLNHEPSSNPSSKTPAYYRYRQLSPFLPRLACFRVNFGKSVYVLYASEAERVSVGVMWCGRPNSTKVVAAMTSCRITLALKEGTALGSVL